MENHLHKQMSPKTSTIIAFPPDTYLNKIETPHPSTQECLPMTSPSIELSKKSHLAKSS